MSEDFLFDITVIGSGPAGTMAMLRSVLNNDRTLFFSGGVENKKESLEFWLNKTKIIPGFCYESDSQRGPYGEAIEFIKKGAFRDKLTHIENISVKRLSRNKDGTFLILDENARCYQTKYIIFCTGVEYRRPIVNDSSVDFLSFENVIVSDYGDRVESLVNGFSEVIILGNDSETFETTFVLHERFSPANIHLLTSNTTTEIKESERHLLNLYKIHYHQHKIISYQCDGKKLLKLELENGEILDCRSAIIYLTLGHRPRVNLLEEFDVHYDSNNFVLANSKGETNESKLYVAGDIVHGVNREIFTAYDSAVDSADDINARLRLEKRNEELSRWRTKK